MTELWLVDLERAAPALQALESDEPRLSADDRNRARQVADPRERRHRITAYIALRVALERFAGRQARGTSFVRTAGGKPSLAVAGLAFSLSHSDRFALIGVTRRGEIGVDVESARSVRMSNSRQQQIVAAGKGLSGMALLADRSDDQFLQAWSRLEAFAKASGRGLARVLEDVGVRGGNGGTMASARIETAARRLVGDTGLQVWDVRLPPGLYGAVACEPAARAPRVRPFPVERSAIERLLVSRAVSDRQSR